MKKKENSLSSNVFKEWLAKQSKGNQNQMPRVGASRLTHQLIQDNPELTEDDIQELTEDFKANGCKIDKNENGFVFIETNLGIIKLPKNFF